MLLNLNAVSQTLQKRLRVFAFLTESFRIRFHVRDLPRAVVPIEIGNEVHGWIIEDDVQHRVLERHRLLGANSSQRCDGVQVWRRITK